MSSQRVVQYGEFLNAIALGAVGVWMLVMDVSAGYSRIIWRPDVAGAVLVLCCCLQIWASVGMQWLASRVLLFISALLWCYLAVAAVLWRPYALDTPALATLAWNAGACYVRSWRFRTPWSQT